MGMRQNVNYSNGNCRSLEKGRDLWSLGPERHHYSLPVAVVAGKFLKETKKTSVDRVERSTAPVGLLPY